MSRETHDWLVLIGAVFVIGFAVGALVFTHDCKAHPEKYGIETVQTQEVTE